MRYWQTSFPVEGGRPQSDSPEKRLRAAAVPLAPPPLAAHTLTADEAWGPTPEDRAKLAADHLAIAQTKNFHPAKPKRNIDGPGNIAA